ncbi:FprA family A-type flavoprotein [Candidatus Bathyarchaeota archaeon]|nr:FprA family A-type flavoprotein [Candidatus Bathyarchaeota archaeon]
MKVIVVYESMYGNTKRVAETIVEGINEADGVDVSIVELKRVELNGIADYDAILIGSPNHFGGPTRGIKGFIDKLGKLQLNGKFFAFFDTYMGNDFEKAANKMEKQISSKIQKIKHPILSLSIKVQGIKGPIADGELYKCKEFGKQIAAHIKEGF